jgi:hypothetical protein
MKKWRRAVRCSLFDVSRHLDHSSFIVHLRAAHCMFHVKRFNETTRPGLRPVGLFLGCERERYGLYDKRLAPDIRVWTEASRNYK